MAVVSDDVAMGITLVMRGDDHISNTPKQILLYEALDAALPTFAHLPMILGMDGKKLSKRHGATAVGDYQHEGILADAMVNFLALLGWSPGGDREIMTRQEMIDLFSPDGLQKKPAVFDPTKLEWMNGQHLSRMPVTELAPIVTRALVQAGLTTTAYLAERNEWYFQLLDLLRVRARTIDDIVRQAIPYFSDRISYDPDAVAKQWRDRKETLAVLTQIRDRLTGLSAWSAENLEHQLRSLAQQMGLKDGKLFQPLRVALTGLSVSPGIFDVLVMLGCDRSLSRIETAIEEITKEGPY
jgi:glutamyl-tRNA synthetase